MRKDCLKFVYQFMATLFAVVFFTHTAQATSPFEGIVINKSNYDDVQNRFSRTMTLRPEGINKYSGGKMLVCDEPQVLGNDSIQKITMIFDHKNILAAVVMKMQRANDQAEDGGFYTAYNELGKKYSRIYENFQGSGKMSVAFTSDDKDVTIRMMAPRNSDSFDLQYLSSAFLQKFEKAKKQKINVSSSEYKSNDVGVRFQF